MLSTMVALRSLKLKARSSEEAGIPRIEVIHTYLEDKMGTRSSNDDRSDSMNPNNDTYWASLDNHSDQMNPNNDEYRGDDWDDEDRK